MVGLEWIINWLRPKWMVIFTAKMDGHLTAKMAKPVRYFKSKLYGSIGDFYDHFRKKLWKQLIHVHDHLVKIQIGSILK